MSLSPVLKKVVFTASDYGLGGEIFDSKVILQTEVMMASLVVIGVVGYAFERLVSGSIERATVSRWGMARMAKG